MNWRLEEGSRGRKKKAKGQLPSWRKDRRKEILEDSPYGPYLKSILYSRLKPA